MFYDIHSFYIIYQDSNISDVVCQMLKSEFRLELLKKLLQLI